VPGHDLERVSPSFVVDDERQDRLLVLEKVDILDGEELGIIDRRVADLRPMIITTQLAANDLGDMLTPDRRDALLRRIRENFDIKILKP